MSARPLTHHLLFPYGPNLLYVRQPIFTSPAMRHRISSLVLVCAFGAWATIGATRPNLEPARSHAADFRAKDGWRRINVDETAHCNTPENVRKRAKHDYREAYRPQFHFTATKNWLNDPNGLVFYEGEYHLFFQHNPSGTEWGNMTWGHAVSRDLVHWRQLANALEPDRLGTMFSGSAVVDWHNTAGLQSGAEPPLIAIYTAAGDTSPESNGQPFTQCIAGSNDRGRTWTKLPENPVIPPIVAGNRDPKVIWHAPSKSWILVLYLEKEVYGLFSSPDLKHWKQLQTMTVPGCSECPDFFELPITGQSGPTRDHRWILTAANGHYLVGRFDGHHYEPDSTSIVSDHGANFYAVQTYSDLPGDRRVQVAWMTGGKYPGMPFNQQMSFPCELTLHDTAEGLRVYRWPVVEIRSLYGRRKTWSHVDLAPGESNLPGLTGDLWDIEAEIECGSAAAVGFTVSGQRVRYSVPDAMVTCLGRSASLRQERGRIRLRLLVDRTSIELFGNGGALSMTSCFLAPNGDFRLGMFAEGGSATITSLRMTPLRSAWH